MGFGSLPLEEIERRRQASITALKQRDQDAFEARYQEDCDRLYWSLGKCCAGCDYWSSECGWTGQCTAAGIMSGKDVMRSIGVEWSSYAFSPGFPYTDAKHGCGLFSDAFDWATLDDEYLRRIGAMKGNVLRAKPKSIATKSPSTPNLDP